MDIAQVIFNISLVNAEDAIRRYERTRKKKNQDKVTKLGAFLQKYNKIK